MKDLVCPYCSKKIKDLVKKGGEGSHLRVCSKGKQHSNPYCIDVVKYNYPEFSSENFIKQKFSEGYTVKGFDDEFFEGRIYVRHLCSFYNIKTPTLKEATSCKKTREKYINTCLEKYGTVNTCANGAPGRKKAEKTMLEKYNVINYFSVDNFQKIIKEKQDQDEYHKRKSERSKNSWLKKSIEEKREWLEKSLFSNKAIRSGGISNLEKEVGKCLLELGFQISPQFYLRNNNKNFFFDYRLLNSNILIEVNGDYWHANPKIYLKDDIIKYPSNSKKAGEVWEKDLIKQKAAEKNNYKVITLWESDILNSWENNTFIYLIEEKLKELGYENYKTKIIEED